MIPTYTLQELSALSTYQLNALEVELNHLLVTLDPDDSTAIAIHDMLALISKARRLKHGRRPSP
ncbi:MAG: hypothetical protein AAGM21_10185 [Pseudomonadota bacterium]